MNDQTRTRVAVSIRTLTLLELLEGELELVEHTHRARMAYADFRNRGIPTGSGAVESMIRQVINMRLKSCGKFWKREAAERMLMARSWWVTGRLEDLWRFTLRQEAKWWNPSQDEDSCAFDYAPLFS